MTGLLIGLSDFLGGPDLSRHYRLPTIYAQSAKKFLGKINSFFPSQKGYVSAPAPRDSLDFPLVDSVTRNILARNVRDASRQLSTAAERFNNRSMGMNNHSRHVVTIGFFVRQVNTADLEDDLFEAARQNSPMADDDRDPYNIECGKRLTLAFESAGYTIRSLARITLADDDDPDSLKRAENKLSKWVNGRSGIKNAFVRQLKPMFGVTMDWVFDGDMSGLPEDLRKAIQERQRRST